MFCVCVLFFFVFVGTRTGIVAECFSPSILLYCDSSVAPHHAKYFLVKNTHAIQNYYVTVACGQMSLPLETRFNQII